MDFLWGAATSAYQVEGGHCRADWVGAGDACAHERLYPADLDLMASLQGLNAYRFSVEWSSIEPWRGRLDRDALAHYGEMVRACRARALAPVVTLWHFTLPRWFAERGGWLHPDAVADFARFAEHVAAALPAPAAWISLNEPNVYVLAGYVAGLWPPQRRRPDLALQVAARLRAAHRAVLPLLRRTAPVGIAHHYAAMASDSALSLAPVADAVFNHAFLREPADFLGLNYYTRMHFAGLRLLPPAGPTQMGWEIHPEGLTQAIRAFRARRLPIVVTENGIATEDDSLRTEYIRAHIDAMRRADADVRGYFYWSLLDNFEWAEGFAPRFGLIGVDHASQARTLRPSARAYAQIALNASKGARQARQ